MKLAAIYSVYNGLELLEKAMLQIRNEVDIFIIVYQKVSNKGEVDLTVKKKVERIAKKFNAKVVLYETDLKLKTKHNELNKHNLGLEVAKLSDCTHFVIGATDHYYKNNEFKKAKAIAVNFDLTLTAMYTYYKKPEWQLYPIEDYLMPFICRLYDNTVFDIVMWKLPYVVDPALRINTIDTHYHFKQDEIMMHHYSMIRTDIKNKFKNAAASVNWNEEKVSQFINEYENAKVGSEISYFKGRKLIEVDNYFNI